MERVVKDLIGYLETEKNLYLELEKLSNAKKSVIISSNIKKLDMIVASEKSIIEKINEVNASIDVIILSLCEHLNIPKENISIEKIASAIYTPQVKKMLLDVSAEVGEVFRRLKKLNKTNQHMISKKLKQTKTKMDLIMLENEISVYDLEGNDKTGKRQKINIFDAKV